MDFGNCHSGQRSAQPSTPNEIQNFKKTSTIACGRGAAHIRKWKREFYCLPFIWNCTKFKMFSFHSLLVHTAQMPCFFPSFFDLFHSLSFTWSLSRRVCCHCCIAINRKRIGRQTARVECVRCCILFTSLFLLIQPDICTMHGRSIRCICVYVHVQSSLLIQLRAEMCAKWESRKIYILTDFRLYGDTIEWLWIFLSLFPIVLLFFFVVEETESVRQKRKKNDEQKYSNGMVAARESSWEWVCMCARVHWIDLFNRSAVI